MAISLADRWAQGITELRYQRSDKRIRAQIAGRTVVDSERAVLVWEPRRVMPCYAVPVPDVLVPLLPATTAGGDGAAHAGSPGGTFRAHTAPGVELSLRVGGGWGSERVLEGAAFQPTDADLDGYVLLDFDAFDCWLEEDEAITGHPRDPFHRFDVRRSSRHVQVLLGERLLADSRAPRLVFETLLPVRFYLPRQDVQQHLLQPSRRQTVCPYKGQASYWSVQLDGYLAEDLLWSYEQPLAPAAELAGLMCFFDERVDLVVDGVRRERRAGVWP